VEITAEIFTVIGVTQAMAVFGKPLNLVVAEMEPYCHHDLVIVKAFHG
jgi:hypothetical protein